MGIDFVTFPAILSQNGVDAGRIGIAATFDIIGGILMSLFLSKLVARLGVIKALFISSFSYAFAISTIYFYQNFYLWIIICFAMGGFWFVYVISRQAWINSLVDDTRRGVALGIFSMMISAGIAVGPVIASVLGANNYISFIASDALAIVSFLVILPIKHKSPSSVASKKIAFKEFFKNNPRCFLARLFLDFLCYCLMVFSVTFGKNIGLSPEKSGLLISAYMMSGFCDVLVGFLLKKQDPYRLINIGFLGCLSCFLVIIFYHYSYFFLLTLYFIFGIFVALIYVSVFTAANKDYDKEKLIAANATFQSIGSLGSLASGLTTGYLINIFGKLGLPFAIVFCCITYLTFLVIYEKKFIKK